MGIGVFANESTGDMSSRMAMYQSDATDVQMLELQAGVFDEAAKNPLSEIPTGEPVTDGGQEDRIETENRGLLSLQRRLVGEGDSEPESSKAGDQVSRLRNGLDDAQSVEGCAPFPESECANERAVATCESGSGTNPAAYSLSAENGGRLQLNRATWQPFFANRWTWEQIVMDDQINREAAYVVWQRAGGSWSPWACSPR